MSPKTLPGLPLPLPEAWPIVCLSEGDFSISWLPVQGEDWCWPLRGCLNSAGVEQHSLSFPNDVGRECDRRGGTHSSRFVQIPLGARSQNNLPRREWLWQLPFRMPQSAEPCFAFSSSFSLTASPLCIPWLQTAGWRSFCWCESL